MVYSNEDKSRAHKQMKRDPQVGYYTSLINGIMEYWAHPQIIAFGETVLLDKIPEMPEEVKSRIKNIESERDKYISENYPELSVL